MGEQPETESERLAREQKAGMTPETEVYLFLSLAFPLSRLCLCTNLLTMTVTHSMTSFLLSPHCFFICCLGFSDELQPLLLLRHMLVPVPKSLVLLLAGIYYYYYY